MVQTVSSELLGFLFCFSLFFSFLSRALDQAGHIMGHRISFWAHVNIPYRVVSYRIVSYEVSFRYKMNIWV